MSAVQQVRGLEPAFALKAPRAFTVAALPAIGLGVLTVALILGNDLRDPQATRVWLEVLIAFGFVAAGLWVLAADRARWFGLLSVAIGCACFVECWRYSGEPLTFTLGATAGNFWGPLMIHLVLAFPSGRLRSRAERRLVVGLYVFMAVAQPVPWLFWTDDFPSVCTDCPRNLALVVPDQRVAAVAFAAFVGIALCIAIPVVVYIAYTRWWRGGPHQRRALVPLVGVAGALQAFLVINAIGEVEHWQTLSRAFAIAYLAAFAAIPFALLAALMRTRTYRAEAIGAIVERLDGTSGPDALRVALARALEDPSLELAYWAPERAGYVDARGRPVSLIQAPGRVWTAIERNGRPLAAIGHDPSLAEEPGLVQSTGAAVALALERERLTAALQARMQDLQASRARIVQAADRARRRLERDLHDGAQQRLVSLLLNLQLARRAEREAPGELLQDVETELKATLGELRGLASGLLPPALSDYGLGAAVEELAARTPLQVTIEQVPSGRLSEPVEIAAYFVIAEALTNVAKHARARRVRVRVSQETNRVTVGIVDDGIGGAGSNGGSGLRGLADRVEALGGHFTVTSPPGRGTTVRAELPCAS